MNLSLFLNPQNLHHAYLLIGSKQLVSNSLISFLEKELGLQTRGNPDFWMSEHTVFGIDDARTLTELHSRRPVVGDKKVYILFCDGVTVEAQNALLKLLEEPASGTHFFFNFPEEGKLLPTLLSRMQKVNVHGKEDKENFGNEFLKASISERMKMVEDLIEEKDKAKTREFIQSLLLSIRKECGNERSLVRMTPVLEDLMKSDDYVSDRASSVKMLLEHIAHTAPKI